MNNYDSVEFITLRDHIYDMFIYQLDINECMWFIISHFIKEKKIKEEHITDILLTIYPFLKHFNNNYRPIYHIENFLLHICKKIHNF